MSTEIPSRQVRTVGSEVGKGGGCISGNHCGSPNGGQHRQKKGPPRYTTTGLGWSRATYAEAYRQMVLSFERRPGELGARWPGFPEGLSDQEGSALLMEYLRRQRTQKGAGPQARTSPSANAGTTPTGAGFPSVVEATSSPSTTGPLVGSGVMGCQPTQ